MVSGGPGFLRPAATRSTVTSHQTSLVTTITPGASASAGAAAASCGPSTSGCAASSGTAIVESRTTTRVATAASRGAARGGGGATSTTSCSTADPTGDALPIASATGAASPATTALEDD